MTRCTYVWHPAARHALWELSRVPSQCVNVVANPTSAACCCEHAGQHQQGCCCCWCWRSCLHCGVDITTYVGPHPRASPRPRWQQHGPADGDGRVLATLMWVLGGICKEHRAVGSEAPTIKCDRLISDFPTCRPPRGSSAATEASRGATGSTKRQLEDWQAAVSLRTTRHSMHTRLMHRQDASKQCEFSLHTLPMNSPFGLCMHAVWRDADGATDRLPAAWPGHARARDPPGHSFFVAFHAACTPFHGPRHTR
jgi:hypothetical protein